MDKVETDFLESQKLKPMVSFWYIDDIFFIWTHGKQEIQQFLQELNKTHPNLKFTHESSIENISLLDLPVSLCNGNLYTDLLIAINIWNRRHLIQSTLRNPSFIVRRYV